MAGNIFRDRFKRKTQGFYELSSIYIAFLLEFRRRKKPLKNGWTTQGIKMSSQKMRFLNMVKKQHNLTEDAKLYIAKYKIIHRRVIREAKRRKMISIFCMQITDRKLCGRL